MYQISQFPASSTVEVLGFLCGRRQERSRYAQGGQAVNTELLGDGEADKLAALMCIEWHQGFQK